MKVRVFTTGANIRPPYREFAACSECAWIGKWESIDDIRVCPACGGTICGFEKAGSGFVPNMEPGKGE